MPLAERSAPPPSSWFRAKREDQDPVPLPTWILGSGKARLWMTGSFIHGSHRCYARWDDAKLARWDDAEFSVMPHPSVMPLAARGAPPPSSWFRAKREDQDPVPLPPWILGSGCARLWMTGHLHPWIPPRLRPGGMTQWLSCHTPPSCTGGAKRPSPVILVSSEARRPGSTSSPPMDPGFGLRPPLDDGLLHPWIPPLLRTVG